MDESAKPTQDRSRPGDGANSAAAAKATPDPVPADRRFASIETTNASAIDHDLPCRTCGYNLRGISTASRCPECGCSVARSLHGDMLEFCDPEWVLRLARGLNWMAIAVILMLAAAAARSTMLARGPHDSSMARWLTISLAIAAGCSGLCGLIMATTCDPALARREKSLAARKVIRISVVIALLMSGALVLTGPVRMRPVGMMHVLAACAAWIVAVLAMFRYGAALARRAASPSLADETRSVASGVLVCLIVLGIASVFGLLAAVGLDSSATTFAIGILTGWSCAALVGLACLGLWSLTLIFRYRSSLRSAAQRARASWAG